MLFFYPDGRCSHSSEGWISTFCFQTSLSKTMYITIFLTIGSEAQGAKAKTVFVRAHWRVRNGKKHFVRAYYRLR